MTKKSFFEIFYKYIPATIFVLFAVILLVVVVRRWRREKNIQKCLNFEIPFNICLKILFGLEIDINKLTNRKENKKDENKIEKQNNNQTNINQLTNINEKDQIETEIESQKDVNNRLKIINLYSHLIVHLIISSIALIIIFVQIVLIHGQYSESCLKSFACNGYIYNAENKKWEEYKCISSENYDQAKYYDLYCIKYGFESFSTFITEIGAFAGLIAAFLSLHKYTLVTIKMINSKLTSYSFLNRIFEKFSTVRFYIVVDKFVLIFIILIEIVALIGLIAVHVLSDKIDYQIEEYMTYICLLLSLIFTAISIERNIFESKKSSKLSKKDKKMLDKPKSMVMSILDNF
jgi:hypothetical protein